MKNKIPHFIQIEDILVFASSLPAIIIIILYIFNNFSPESTLYNSILNLSYSYIAAMMFYFLQACIPRIIIARKALNVLSPGITEVYNKLLFAEKFLNCFVLVSDDDRVNIPEMRDGLVYYMQDSGKMRAREFQNILAFAENFPKNIHKAIADIECFENYTKLPNGLIATFNKIKMARFLSIGGVGTEYPDCERYIGIRNDIATIGVLRTEIMPYLTDIPILSISPLSEAEIADYMNTLHMVQPSLQQFAIQAQARQKTRQKRTPLQ